MVRWATISRGVVFHEKPSYLAFLLHSVTGYLRYFTAPLFTNARGDLYAHSFRAFQQVAYHPRLFDLISLDTCFRFVTPEGTLYWMKLWWRCGREDDGCTASAEWCIALATQLARRNRKVEIWETASNHFPLLASQVSISNREYRSVKWIIRPFSIFRCNGSILVSPPDVEFWQK